MIYNLLDTLIQKVWWNKDCWLIRFAGKTALVIEKGFILSYSDGALFETVFILKMLYYVFWNTIIVKDNKL